MLLGTSLIFDMTIIYPGHTLLISQRSVMQGCKLQNRRQTSAPPITVRRAGAVTSLPF